MADRISLAEGFLAGCGWAQARRAPLAGDASMRCYTRLKDRALGRTAVLMDAAGESGRTVVPFMRIANLLARLGLSAPDILAADPRSGFLLLEDFGDTLYPTVIESDPASETLLYSTAVDVLAALDARPPPKGLGTFGPAEMSRQALLVADWYVPEPGASWRAALQLAIEAHLRRILPADPVLVLRDFHAENLIWLNSRQGLRRAGLLDFQDATAGPRGYDLVSLLEDARRTVPPDLVRAMIDRFLSATGLDPQEFGATLAALGAQRSLRILGVFARLSRRDGKPRYVDMIPRVRRHLAAALAHPELAGLRDIVEASLPEAGSEHLNWLRGQCQ